MNPLPTELRNKLERTIVEARDVAEAGAKAALEAIAVHYYEPYAHMSLEDRKLRNHLRARARQLGDKQNPKGELEITHLVWECAYEHWHRMLFARFLAENDLLIEPEMGVAISLEECEELGKEYGKDLWMLASEFAQSMLPQIFRPNDPVLKVNLAREHRMKLENLLNDLESAIFMASDSLGWVYQFWQSKRKKEVNQSGNKIGADELPAVTQLFTEPYMVSFLLDNSLGAWWAARCDAGMGRRADRAKGVFERAETEEEIRKACVIPGVPLKYLRFIKQGNGTWAPAAGTFDGWPKQLSELKVLDPCCGSGHFLVAAFFMLVPMRMELEGLSARDACDAVLRENLHGLEIDRRCVELAAFALALAAWRYPDACGYRVLPELNLACSGLSISGKKDEWLALAGDNTNLRVALEELYKQFKDAPVLGSLINPEASLGKGSLFELKWEEVGSLLTKALAGERDDEKNEIGVVAKGIARASWLQYLKYHLVMTNVPYLLRRKQSESLYAFLRKYYPDSKHDLATAFLERANKYCVAHGTTSIVLPSNWLFLKTYKKLREKSLSITCINLLSQLGTGAFQTISGEVVSVILYMASRSDVLKGHRMCGLDASDVNQIKDKTNRLICGDVVIIEQKHQKNNPDAWINLSPIASSKLLELYASAFAGLRTGDTHRFTLAHWEIDAIKDGWVVTQSSFSSLQTFAGCVNTLLWEDGKGQLFEYQRALAESRYASGGWKQGWQAWGNEGVLISQMGELKSCIFCGAHFEIGSAVILPKEIQDLPAIWAYCSTKEYFDSVRKVNPSLFVTNASLVKVPFDLDHWTKVAAEKYPNGLPKPYSDDPTQWIFHGHTCGSVVWDEEAKWTAHGPLRNDDTVLQVAVARLLGYRWPAELDPEMELADEQREWVGKCSDLLKYADEDGIVCIPSVRGEETGDSRLRVLLAAAFGHDWSPLVEQELIKNTGANVPNLDEWLRDHFFEQHCKLFHHRPFIWHIWDGRRRDGFHALVNYHKLVEGYGKGRQLLENLTYSYLGEWISRQREGVKRGEGGTEDRLSAALELQKRLIAIIEGEPPFDIFVRWNPIEKQPIGWETFINDGVRLNIRPFLAQDIPGGRKGTGILRWKPNIKWGKDRGKEPFRPKEQFPWFWKDDEFTGDRVNDIHLTINDKQKARKEKKQT